MLPEKWHEVFKRVIAQHKLDLPFSCHGPDHWFRVIENGLRIADAIPEVDRDVVIAFGLFHDSARTHDNHCTLHGPASIGVIRSMTDIIPLTPQQVVKLCIACGAHTKASPNEKNNIDITIQACWDADRLDLLRVGIIPDNQYLFTEAAKDAELQAWANPRADAHMLPETAGNLWPPHQQTS